jgi:DNA polymerase III alpha subunit (gram-positive type)
MKSYLLTLSLAAFPAVICAQQADPCAGLVDYALGQCRGDQQKLQQQQLEQQHEQLHQQQERQNQLAEQQRQMQQQLENMRLQNELLQKQLEYEKSASQLDNMRLQNELLQKQLEHEKSASKPVQRSVTDYSKTAEVKSWKSDNPWYGTDYAKTAFAMRYAKQLQQEQPDLVGRPFLDAVSEKVADTFGASK